MITINHITLFALLLIANALYAAEKVTLTTTAGITHEDVKVLDNGPDSLVVLDKNGVYTLMKNTLTEESKLLVGYDVDADLSARKKKEQDAKNYAIEEAKRAKIIKEKGEANASKLMEMRRLQAIADAEAAKVALVQAQRAYQLEQEEMRIRERRAEQRAIAQAEERAAAARQQSIEDDRRAREQESALRREQLILENELIRKRTEQEDLRSRDASADPFAP